MHSGGVPELYPSSLSCMPLIFSVPPGLPPDSKLHNLLSLAAKDVEIAPSPQDSGSHLILQHQKLMLDHFGHKHHAVLPEDVIQRLLLGVRILVLIFSACIPYHLSIPVWSINISVYF